MAFSKPTHVIYELVGAYFENLYNNPIKTKAITSCVIALLGNLVSQKLTRAKYLNQDSLIAFGLFGLFFGGPLPHYFYQYVQLITKNSLGILLIERLIYMPCFQALALYMLARFEGKSHERSYDQLKRLYWPVLITNWKYLTLLGFINIRYVPPVLRVLVVNIIGFFWSIFIAIQREKAAKDKSSRDQ